MKTDKHTQQNEHGLDSPLPPGEGQGVRADPNGLCASALTPALSRRERELFSGQDMAGPRWHMALALMLGLVLAAAAPTKATQIQNLARIQGAEPRQLFGTGLVVGLNGTGDSDRFRPKARAVASVLQRTLDEMTTADEVAGARNVAVVWVTATVPASGVRVGDAIDVRVMAMYDARSLEGGHLVMVPMVERGDDSPVFATASGPITLENPEMTRAGRIAAGAQMEVDVLSQTMDARGQVTLVLHNSYARWTVAANITNLINSLMAPDGPKVARAIDQRNIVIRVPEADRGNPATFISQVLQLRVHQSLIAMGATVRINERTGTIVIGGDVQIAPVIITHGDLTISTRGDAAAGQVNGEPEPGLFARLDPDEAGGEKLEDLVRALNQLQVPVADRIAIIKTLHADGYLAAELIFE